MIDACLSDTCGSTRIIPHCRDPKGNRHPGCDLVMCKRCGSYGMPDGRRWVDRQGRRPDGDE